ncbi:MAG: cytochrome c-type biogenesis protein [Gammaproteobacteria bacterium]
MIRDTVLKPAGEAGAWLLMVLLSLSVFATATMAKEAAPLVADPVIEARMAALGSQLRCLVCQGQSIAESDSGFANDVRREMRIMMEQGRSDVEVTDFLVQRYGDFILFKPPMNAATALLWLGPFILVLLAGSVLFITLKRRRRQTADEQLTAEQIRRAEALLDSGTDNDGDKA